jgi:hypothetical protein
VRTKKLRKVKIQLSLESSDVRLPLPDFGKHVWPVPAELLQIRSDPDHFGQIRPDQLPDSSTSGRINCRIRSHPASFGRNLVRQHPATVAGCHRIPAQSVFRSPDVARFRHCMDSDNRPLLNSVNQISNMRTRTKSLISENDLRF